LVSRSLFSLFLSFRGNCVSESLWITTESKGLEGTSSELFRVLGKVPQVFVCGMSDVNTDAHTKPWNCWGYCTGPV
jgi:hypothetical protein